MILSYIRFKIHMLYKKKLAKFLVAMATLAQQHPCLIHKTSSHLYEVLIVLFNEFWRKQQSQLKVRMQKMKRFQQNLVKRNAKWDDETNTEVDKSSKNTAFLILHP